jgi:hypothetical protein
MVHDISRSKVNHQAISEFRCTRILFQNIERSIINQQVSFCQEHTFDVNTCEAAIRLGAHLAGLEAGPTIAARHLARHGGGTHGYQRRRCFRFLVSRSP